MAEAVEAPPAPVTDSAPALPDSIPAGQGLLDEGGSVFTEDQRAKMTEAFKKHVQGKENDTPAAVFPEPDEDQAKAIARTNNESEPTAEAESTTKDASTDNATDGTDADSAETGATESESESEIDAKRLEAAKQALRRAKHTQETIEGLPPQRVLELGESVAKDQAAVDDKLRRQGDVEQMVKDVLQKSGVKFAPESDNGTQSTGQPAATTPQTTTWNVPPTQAGVQPGTTPQAVPQSNDQVQQAIAAAMAPIQNDEAYGDVAKAMNNGLTSVAQVLAGQHQAQIDAQLNSYQSQFTELKTTLDAMRQENERLQNEVDTGLYLQGLSQFRSAARDLAAGDYPQLSDADNLKRVESRARSLANLPGYTDQQGLMDWDKLVGDAAHLELGRDIKRQTQAQLSQRHRDQANGQPEPVVDRSEQKREPKSQAELQRQAYDAIFRDNMAPAQVRQQLAKQLS